MRGVATVLCTDGVDSSSLILTLPLLLRTVEKTEQQVSNKRQQDSKVNLIKQIPAGLIKTSAVAKPRGKKLIC